MKVYKLEGERRTVMPLTIQYCADLHLEFELNRKWIKKYPLTVTGDVLLLGGDIMLLAQMEQHNDFLDLVAGNYKAVYWIPGNHEYYHADIGTARGAMLRAVRENVFLVNNSTVSVGDTDIICATLWSHIDPAHQWEITRAMSDFHIIDSGERKLDIQEYNLLHAQDRQYIVDAVAASTAAHKVVLTHHVPTFMNYPEKYKGGVLNQAFASELHDFIHTSGIDYWIYGHTHNNTPDFTIGKTRLLTNQLGYVRHGEHTDFNAGKVFVVG